MKGFNVKIAYKMGRTLLQASAVIQADTAMQALLAIQVENRIPDDNIIRMAVLDLAEERKQEASK